MAIITCPLCKRPDVKTRYDRILQHYEPAVEIVDQSMKKILKVEYFCRASDARITEIK